MIKSSALFWIRLLHTTIYLIMVAAIALMLVAGITGYQGLWLWISIGLVAAEGLVFFGNGMRCPLTSLAVRHGATKGHAFDTFLPEKWTRFTFRCFGTPALLGLLLLVLRWVGIVR